MPLWPGVGSRSDNGPRCLNEGEKRESGVEHGDSHFSRGSWMKGRQKPRRGTAPFAVITAMKRIALRENRASRIGRTAVERRSWMNRSNRDRVDISTDGFSWG
jgi:hypothetical protein